MVLNAMHRSDGEGAGHIDSTSLVNLCDITLTNLEDEMVGAILKPDVQKEDDTDPPVSF